VYDINTCDGLACPAGTHEIEIPDPPYETTSSSM
jgi:hypothetical protein